jgi:RNA polymerase sigma factor (TIGR02999 family)
MSDRPRGDVTRILEELRSEGGQPPDGRDVLDRLLPVLYEELRTLARAHLRRERPDHSLQATALVHEAYVRLVDARGQAWEDGPHFFRAAALAMRRLLVDHARRRGQQKRGGGMIRVTLDGSETKAVLPLEDALALDEAILRLEEQDARMAEVVSLRFFAGLSVEETAKTMGVSERTVKREWAVARAWLFDALRD